MRRLPMTARVAALLIAGMASGCGDGDGSRRHVVLVTLDTTRADALASYGNPAVRTPVMDAWARAGGQAAVAVADVPLTLPSHVTMFTGTPALFHGIRTNHDFRLGENAPTVAEALRAAGWSTAAIVSSVVLDRETGIGQGFQTYDDDLQDPYVMQNPDRFPAATHWLPDVDRRAVDTVARAVATLRDLARGGEPFFLWVHLYDPHFPYDAPPPADAVQPDPYLAEVESVDRQLARLERAVADLGIRDDTAWIVTADHGEGLDDHGEAEHGILLYEEAIRVPLLIRAPGVIAAGTLLEGPARTVDLASTVLELAGAGKRLGAGASLVGAFRGTSGVPGPWAYCETILPHLSYGGSPLKAYRTATRKLVWAPRPELYDLIADPGERRDLAAERPAEVDSLAEELEDIVLQTLRWPPGWAEVPVVDPARTEALRSLGYIAGDEESVPKRTAPEEMETPGTDPKDLVLVAGAGRDVENGFHSRAAAKLRRFVETADPPEVRAEMAPLWSLARQNRGAIALHAGRFQDAAGELREALRLEPGNEAAAWELVMALNLDGRPAEAERAADEVLARRPGAGRVRVHRALALALQGRGGEAREALSAVAADGAGGDEGAVSAARFFAERLGTADEAGALEFYRESWRIDGVR